MNGNITGKDHDELLYNISNELKNAPEYSPRGMKTKEIINASLTLEDPYKRLVSNTARNFSDKYVAAETIWYLSGEQSIEEIKDYASLWEKVANDDGTANSAYGHQIWGMELENYDGNQYDWVVDKLTEDKNSRQAVINYNLPEHKFEKNKDYVCTLNSQFLIRDNKLDMITNMRSNDGIYGLGNDLPFFTFLQEMVLHDVNEAYDGEIEMGKYHHNPGSLHVYEKHYNTLDNIIDQYNPSIESREMPRVDSEFMNERNQHESNYESGLGTWLYNNKHQ